MLDFNFLNSSLGYCIDKKIKEIPELKDVFEKLLELSIDENKQIKIDISVKDFGNSTNTMYEKIIKRGF